MPPGLHSLATSLPRSATPGLADQPMPELPIELIYEEILPHLYDESPKSFDDLQVAFTCKAFYHYLRPMIAQFCVDCLLQAKSRKLGVYRTTDPPDEFVKVKREAFRRIVEAAFEISRSNPLAPGTPEPTADDEPDDGLLYFAYEIHVGTFNDADTLWSFISLLSKLRATTSTALNLSFESKPPTDGQEYMDPSPSWARAFTKLWATSVEPQAARLRLGSEEGTDIRSLPEGPLGPTPPCPSPPFSRSQLRTLTLAGVALGMLWPSHSEALLYQSSSTLETLEILGCQLPNSGRWESLLSKCHLPRLVKLAVENTNIPSNVLTSFLILNTSIKRLIIRIPSKLAYRPGNRLSMRPEDRARFLPCLRELWATTDFLLALFYPASDAKPEISFDNLESVTIMDPRDAPASSKFSDIYGNVTRLLSCIGRSTETGKRHFPSLNNLTLELQYNPGETERWLKSASLRDVGDGTIYSIKSQIQTVASLFASSVSRPFNLAQVLSTLDNIQSVHLTLEKKDSRTCPSFAIHPYYICSFAGALPRVGEVALEGMFNGPELIVANSDVFLDRLDEMWRVCRSMKKLAIKSIGNSGPDPIVWERLEEPVPGFEDMIPIALVSGNPAW